MGRILQMKTEELRNLIEKINHERTGGIRSVVFIAAGGSNGGNYPAQYFLDRESLTVRTQSFTSNEFVYAPPKFVNSNTLAVITSMRGTPETCRAAAVAKERGAATIGLYIQESELTRICDHNIQYESIMSDDADQGNTNAAWGLKIAMTVLDVVEGYDHYDKAMAAFPLVDPIYREAVDHTRASAAKWAEKNKDANSILVMGSGPAFAAAYIFSICNIMEMLQISSPTINCCEFFHGPFEVIDKETSVFLLLSEGRVRPADERVVAFMNRYGGENFYILDAKEIGLDSFDKDIREYFNHLIFSPVLNNVYMKALAASTHKDYMSRSYMWKVQY